MMKTNDARNKFGEIAVKKGYIADEKVDQALVLQRELKEKGLSHKKLGEILVEMDLLTNKQVEEILQTQDAGQRPIWKMWLAYLFLHRR